VITQARIQIPEETVQDAQLQETSNKLYLKGISVATSLAEEPFE
jgi:hypothetical protein